MGQSVLLEHPGDSLLDDGVFFHTKTVVNHDMGCQNMMLTIKGPEMLVMHLIDTINPKQRTSNLFMEGLVRDRLEKQLPCHPEITHNVEQNE